MANLGYIQITRRCNQNCRFCSNPDNGRTLDMEQAREFVDDFVRRDYHGIILTGGEPTLFTPLDELILYAHERGMPSRMITNGQKAANFDYLKILKDSGLVHMTLSIHSVDAELHDDLTRTPGSFRKQVRCLENAEKLGITVDVNCVINKRNADKLEENVRWLTERFPFLHHFVWNNLDPSMNENMDHDALVPRLRDFEISLYRAMRFLESTGRTFRAEKVPLCYMPEYAHCSTETRKIIKNEERVIHFLDDKRTFKENRFEHVKAEICVVCGFNEICAGLFFGNTYYDLAELSPIFQDPDSVRKRIFADRETNPDEKEILPELPSEKTSA